MSPGPGTPSSLAGDALHLVAERFKALGEPTRLRLLAALHAGERSVSELVEATALGQANVSKQLRLLHTLGFVSRRRDGLHVRYALSDPSVFTLCDIACGGITAQLEAKRRSITS